MQPSRLASIALILSFSAGLQAESPQVFEKKIRDAVARSIPLLEAGSKGSADQRQCFTCHSQALPVFVLTEAKSHGFTIDEANLQRQLQHTYDHLHRGHESYQKAKGQGGGVLTAGYALWALEAGKWKSDPTITAVTHYLVEEKVERGHWQHRGTRPPSSGSDFTTSYVALRGLTYYGNPDQSSKIADRKAVVAAWLSKQIPKDTEDSVFRLKSMRYVDIDSSVSESATTDLLQLQRDDGGWSQNAELDSDAYATATVVETLLGEGKLDIEHPSIRKGIDYLLRTQLNEGTWKVTTRAKPFQEYFESGFPHGKDQFISISATAWSALALLAALPETTHGE